MGHHEWDRDMEGLKSDIAKMRSELLQISDAVRRMEGGGEAADSAVSLARRWAEAVPRLKDAVPRMKETVPKLKEAYESARERGMRSMETVGHEIEKRPFLSVLAVLGTGALVGRFLQGRQH